MIANAAVILDTVDADTRAKIAPDKFVELPVFSAYSPVANETAAVTLRTTLNALAGSRVGDVILLKLRPYNKPTVLIGKAGRISEIDHALYVVTDASGNPIPDETIVKGKEYYITLGIQDNSDYDWDPQDNEILDPTIATVASSGSSDTSSGGCSSGVGAFGLALLAAALLRTAPRKRK
ncbi:MAG: hypothetical protein LBS53_09205 [Synergistaceae bacterium]|nr:hypothetical protein [Synergistaceae bacterium]